MTTNLRLGVVSDIHISPEGTGSTDWHNAYDFAGTADRLQGAIEYFTDQKVDGVVFLGDLTQRGDEISVEIGLATLARAPGRLWIARGNHDLELSAGDLSGQIQGDVLANGLRLAVLRIDTVDRGATFRARPSLNIDSWGNDLTLLSSHFPLISRAAELATRGFPYPGDLLERASLLDALIARTGPTVVLSGHLHIRDACSSGPVLQLFFSSVIEHPFECSIVELTELDGRHRVSRVAVPLHAGLFVRDPVFVPAAESWEFDGTVWLSLE